MSVSRRLLASAAGGVLILGTALVAPPASATLLDGCVDSPSAIDLNGDGFDDAVVGDPYATVDGQAEAGRVTVLFGDADGRIGEGRRLNLTQADFGDETPEAGDHFGWSVAVGRADENLVCASLLVGAPGETVNGQAGAGMVHLANFRTDDEGQATTLESSNVTEGNGVGAAEAGDQFGYAVALMGPTFDDPYRFVVGSPGEDAGAVADAGAITVFDVQGSPSPVGQYLQGRVANNLGQRIPGTTQAGDRFGASLAALSLRLGDSGSAAVVVGAPGDVVNDRDGAGSVTVLQNADDNGPFEHIQQITENSKSVPGVAEAGDAFGTSVALSPFTSGYLPRTLAVGAPGEDRGTVADAGAVTLFSNQDKRLVPGPSLTQASQYMPGTVEAGDQFGAAVAFRYPNDLLVGVPGEDVGTVVDAGIAQPVGISNPEFAPRGTTAIDENAQGTRYGVAADSRFGSTVGGITGVRESVFLVSSVNQGNGSVLVDSNKSVFEPTTGDLPSRSWVPGEDGIAASPGGRFGWALSGPNWTF